MEGTIAVAVLGGILALMVVVVYVSTQVEERANRGREVAEQANVEFRRQLEAEIEARCPEAGKISLMELAPHDFGYRPMKSEHLLGVQRNVIWLEILPSGPKERSRGRLLITDQAVVFEGTPKSRRFRISSIFTGVVIRDGYELRPRSGNGHFFASPEIDLNAAVAFEVILRQV